MSVSFGLIPNKNPGICHEDEIIEAIIDDDIEEVGNILSRSPKLINKTTFNIENQSKLRGSILPLDSLSLMHVAAFFDSLEVFVFLENEYDLSISVLSGASIHPIQYAVYGYSLEVAMYILENHPEEAKIETSFSYALFYCAASSPKADDDRMIQLLYMKKTPLLPNHDSNLCPIQKAIKLKNIPILKGLLKIYRPKNVNEGCDILTPLMTSISYGLASGVDLLLEAGENPLFVTPDGRCALSHACFINHKVDGKDSSFEIIQKLLNAIGNHNIEPFEKYKSGPIQWICQSKSPQIARLIFDFHPEVDVNRVDENFISAPTTLANKDMPIKDIIELLTLFIDKGYDLNRYNIEKGQKTVLESFCITMKPKPEVVKFLLDNGSDPYLPFIGNYKSPQKRTIYQIALQKRELRSIMTEYEENSQKNNEI